MVTIGAAKERAVLSLLALRAGSMVSTSELVEALWGPDPPRSARGAVQTYVSNLRKALPPGTVVTVPGGYRATIEPGAVDAVGFEGAVAAARAAAGNPALRAETLTAALGLWRGVPLVDLAASAVGVAEATRLGELRRAAEEDLFQARLDGGDQVAVVADLEVAVAAEPLRERRWGLLMLALYRCGRQGDALRAYQRLRRMLGDELGVEPGVETRALEAAILAQDPALILRVEPLGVEPRVVVGAADAAPGELDNPALSHNLPHLVSSFVGRRGAAGRGAPVGGGAPFGEPGRGGGAGKTRLGLQVAAGLADSSREGVWLVELAALSDPGMLPGAVADVLGIKAHDQRSLVEVMGDQDLLLVLDNCEHLLGACAKLADALLRRCPRVHVLATSREPLVSTARGLPGTVAFAAA